MIKPQELVNGRYVNKGIINFTCVEDGIWGAYIHENRFDASLGIFYPLSEIEGIPISEEWLNRFGFKYRNGYGFKKNNFELIAIKVIGSNGYHFRYQLINVEIEYVHQLQNLYQSIKREELTIKE